MIKFIPPRYGPLKILWCIFFASIFYLVYKKTEIEERIAEHIISTAYYSSFRSVRTIDEFYQFLDLTHSACKNVKRYGGSFESENLTWSARALCADDSFHMSSKDCVILSFGIHDETSFERALLELGCTVHCFNPYIKDMVNKQKYKKYALRLSNRNEVIRTVNETIQISRYPDVLTMLNLSSAKIIDYLHLELDSYEWQFFDDIFKNTPQVFKNVKQIGIEVHLDKYEGNGQITSKIRYQQLWRYFHNLEKLGFLLVDYRAKQSPDYLYEWNGRNLTTAFDIVWGQYQIDVGNKDYYKRHMV